jgi:hypothetical protein
MPINSIQATTYAETLFKHAAWQDILSHHLDPGSPPKIPLTLSGDITGSPAQSPSLS